MEDGATASIVLFTQLDHRRGNCFGPDQQATRNRYVIGLLYRKTAKRVEFEVSHHIRVSGSLKSLTALSHAACDRCAIPAHHSAASKD